MGVTTAGIKLRPLNLFWILPLLKLAFLVYEKKNEVSKNNTINKKQANFVLNFAVSHTTELHNIGSCTHPARKFSFIVWKETRNLHLSPKPGLLLYLRTSYANVIARNLPQKIPQGSPVPWKSIAAQRGLKVQHNVGADKHVLECSVRAIETVAIISATEAQDVQGFVHFVVLPRTEHLAPELSSPNLPPPIISIVPVFKLLK